jgi:hypothetical protein
VHKKGVTNPFTYGTVARDAAFADREDELRELLRDFENGQDVVVFAPRRYGKSSLVLRAAKRARRGGALVAYCDLMRTPTKEQLAAALARSIHRELASAADRTAEAAARLFRGLRIRPTVEVGSDGIVRFTFQAARRRADIDDTIEGLLELPAQIAEERKRRVVLVFDEFQEVVAIDPRLPNLMRAVFQLQTNVAHVYLGSKRHVVERIFSDRNAPFWRSARRVELGPIPRAKFTSFLRRRFAASEREITAEAVERLLEVTQGHPYATQELAHFVWERVPEGRFAYPQDVDDAIEAVLRSENNHFATLWDEASRGQRLLLMALAAEPTPSVYAADYHARHELPANPSLQTALRGLVAKDVVGRDDDGAYRIVEPFLPEWLARGAG